jgi:hypothetical protein
LNFPAASGDIYVDFRNCCSQDFLQVLPEEAALLLCTGQLQDFAARYPEFRSRFAAELRALSDVMTWIRTNGEEESRRRSRGD